MSLIPEFQFNKDSYIVKHKLDYNTKCDGNWSGETYGILFTDYDLARKTQSKNAEVFNDVVIDIDKEDVLGIRFIKYDTQHTILTIGRWFNTELVLSGETMPYFIESGATFVSTNDYQRYYVPSGSTALFDEGDLFNIYFHVIEEISGTTTWSHFGAAGEEWVTTGTTENGIPFQVTGVTTENGYSSGVTNYNIIDYDPILKYTARAINYGNDYIDFERKLEDYIYNNIMKSAKDYNYQSVSYTIESLNYSDESFYGLKYILEETIWSKYFDVIASSDSLILSPTPNKEDLYFDYDNVEIELLTTGETITYKFETDCLYAKYKLDRFLEQFGFGSGTTINFDNICGTDINTPIYTESNEDIFTVYLNDSGDTTFFTPYTYIYANTSGSTHICLILNIEDDMLTLLMPRFGLSNGDQIINIQNLHTVEDISKMLYEVFINIESDVDEFGNFYTGNYYDPNIIGLNVIDPNESGDWVFDPS